MSTARTCLLWKLSLHITDLATDVKFPPHFGLVFTGALDLEGLRAADLVLSDEVTVSCPLSLRLSSDHSSSSTLQEGGGGAWPSLYTW